jgi:K+/H+ antiporter YhaU regulatory subunit KhtT
MRKNHEVSPSQFIILMKITEHLEQIEKLVLRRASPAKIRWHIHAIREQLEAYEQRMKNAPDYKKRIAQLKASQLKLKAKIAMYDSEAGQGYYVMDR